jgi:hypothetical protein
MLFLNENKQTKLNYLKQKPIHKLAQLGHAFPEKNKIKKTPLTLKL